jgi:hypothetical protein
MPPRYQPVEIWERRPGAATAPLGGYRRWGRLVGVADPRSGGCTAAQRSRSAINLYVPFHTLIPDGLFDLARPGRALFVRLPAPGEDELDRILTRIIRRVARHIARDREVERAIEEDTLSDTRSASVPHAPGLAPLTPRLAPTRPTGHLYLGMTDSRVE